MTTAKIFRFQFPYEDKWLYMGSSYSCLRDDMEEWLYNCCEKRWRFEFIDPSYCLLFEREEDYNLFLLRWS